MSLPSGELPALSPPGEVWPPGPKPPDEGWTRRKFVAVLVFVLAFHVALILLFGTRKPTVPRAVNQVPHLQLAGDENEFIALGNPTLFALPNQHDLVSQFWRQMPALQQPHFSWTEAPRYLDPEAETFGSAFLRFMGTNRPADYPQEYKPKPDPKFIAVPISIDDPMPQATTMAISGELEQRRLLRSVTLPTLPRNDVIAPSIVQALVDTVGNVASAVVLEPTTDGEADQLALKLARDLRFAPAPVVTVGEITFTWHTVPTNAAPAITGATNAP